MKTTDDNIQCRVCGNTLHRDILHLKEMPLTDEFIHVQKPCDEFLKDIVIFQCDSCSLVQNPIDFNYSKYYEDYEYSSGHSEFTKKFMINYANFVYKMYKNISGSFPETVIEVGSGDGNQLKFFLDLGVESVLGIEPSKSLAKQSEDIGVPAFEGLFSNDIVTKIGSQKFNICISSYTLDHVPNPVDYLKTSNKLLSNNGILAFEVHDINKIYQRSEWCLFEHEHTIYMDKNAAIDLVERYGFKVICINPFHENDVRANSLIVVAKKVAELTNDYSASYDSGLNNYPDLNSKINQTISKIDAWIKEVTSNNQLIGWGVGGRGVMTLAALNEFSKFEVIIDSNYNDGELLTPKTRIPIFGTNALKNYSNAYCLVFSFGYLDEIKKTLLEHGFNEDRIIGLNAFYKE